MDIEEIIDKLIGPTHPVGSHERDSESFDNLVDMCDLIESLIRNIDDIAGYQTSKEASVKKAGEYAAKFLEEIR